MKIRIILTSIALIFWLNLTTGYCLSNEELDDLVKTLNIKLDKQSEKELRKRFKNYMYKEDVEKLIQNEPDHTKIVALSKIMGLSNIEKIEVNNSLIGKVLIKIYAEKLYNSDKEYSQKTLSVANNQISNSILDNDMENIFVTYENYYTNNRNIVTTNRCEPPSNSYKFDIEIQNIRCEEVHDILKQIKNKKNFSYNGYANYFSKIDLSNIYSLKKDNLVYSIYTKESDWHNYHLKLEKIDNKLYILSILEIES